MAEMFFIPDKEEAWVAATRTGSETTPKGVVHFMTKPDGSKQTVKDKDLQNCETVTQATLDSTPINLVDLESFSEGIILHMCKKRFLKDQIYTFVGTILVAVNPFRPLNIYTDENIKKFRLAAQRAEPLEPHVFAVSALALDHMNNDKKSQSVLISGESGAGKTETTKKILQYLAGVAGKTSRRGSSVNVGQQILESNPILESFGNAKTGRNNNSSRFGKWMEINFLNGGKIKGCRIINYLLEKSRVVFQIPNERNYHIFYMMLQDPAIKRKFSLGDAADYHYLNQSGCNSVNGRDEVEEQREMTQAFNSLEFSEETQDNIFEALAGILNLGNINFQESVDAAGNEKVTIVNPNFSASSSKLLGFNNTVLEQALCWKKVVTPSETILKPLTAVQAADQRDALAKEIYRQIFDWLVRRVNSSIYKGDGDLSIGVLDIYGFELFKVNSFEQLCINFANEKLQFFFNAVIFEGEMAMYRSEGIDCTEIKFQDNQGCLDLIEKSRVGIFAKLDEELIVPNGSDQGFIRKCHQAFGDGKQAFYKKDMNPDFFIVKHFAGEVSYKCTNFLEKNKDALAELLTDQLENSSKHLIKETFCWFRDNANAGITSPTKRGGAGSLNKPTIGKKFKSNLDNLMNSLSVTAPHFIRCVKSNSKQSPKIFEAPLCLRQLKYAGLFEAIRIRKAGYAYRFLHDYFVQKYHLTCSKSGLDDKQYCEAILKELEGKSNGHLLASDWRVGRTKVFIKSKQARLFLEEARNAAILRHVVVLQSFFRMGLAKIHTFAAKYEAIRKKKEALKKQREEEERKKKEEADRKAREEEERKIREERERKEKERLAKIEEERRIAAEIAERERKEKERGILAIQGVCRIFHARRAAAVLRMCKQLDRAMNKREDRYLETVIHNCRKLAKHSSKLRNKIEDAKDVLYEVKEQQEILGQLEDAIEGEDILELQAAIALAGQHMLSDKPECVHAVSLCHDLQLREKARVRIEKLSSSSNNNQILENADELSEAIDEAERLGVPQDCISSARGMLTRIMQFLPIRNSMRVAVERGSRKLMLSSLKQRNEQCESEGHDFCLEEQLAIKNMLRMFSFEVQLKGGKDVKPPPGEKPQGTGKSVGFESVDDGERERGAGEEKKEGDMHEDIDDIRLPEWAFSQFTHIQNMETESEKRAGLRDLRKCVGGEEKLREIRRVYQWVSQYSTWRHPGHENLVLPENTNGNEDDMIQAQKYRSKLAIAKSMRTPTKTPLRSGSSTRDKSHLKAATPSFKRSGGKTDTGRVRRRGGGGSPKLPSAEKKIDQMMKDYSTFYDTHRIPLDWRP